MCALCSDCKSLLSIVYLSLAERQGLDFYWGPPQYHATVRKPCGNGVRMGTTLMVMGGMGTECSKQCRNGLGRGQGYIVQGSYGVKHLSQCHSLQQTQVTDSISVKFNKSKITCLTGINSTASA